MVKARKHVFTAATINRRWIALSALMNLFESGPGAFTRLVKYRAFGAKQIQWSG